MKATPFYMHFHNINVGIHSHYPPEFKHVEHPFLLFSNQFLTFATRINSLHSHFSEIKDCFHSNIIYICQVQMVLLSNFKYDEDLQGAFCKQWGKANTRTGVL